MELKQLFQLSLYFGPSSLRHPRSRSRFLSHTHALSIALIHSFPLLSLSPFAFSLSTSRSLDPYFLALEIVISIPVHVVYKYDKNKSNNIPPLLPSLLLSPSPSHSKADQPTRSHAFPSDASLPHSHATTQPPPLSFLPCIPLLMTPPQSNPPETNHAPPIYTY